MKNKNREENFNQKVNIKDLLTGRYNIERNGKIIKQGTCDKDKLMRNR